MSTGPLPWTELARAERKQIDCVEIYLPKSIGFLSELYQLLREMVTNRFGQMVLDGFSIYEVDGVFRGEQQLWDQRTLVIRLLLIRISERPAPLAETTINDLGWEIATRVAPKEEEIWICHFLQNLLVFPGARRLLT